MTRAISPLASGPIARIFFHKKTAQQGAVLSFDRRKNYPASRKNYFLLFFFAAFFAGFFFALAMVFLFGLCRR